MTARRRTAAGFTLVEMMVALALGLLLSIVIAQLFANTRDTNRATEDAARVQESMRFATDVIGRTVRIAGYMSNPTAAATTVFPGTAKALDGSNGAGTASDTLIVRFQGAGTPAGAADNTILDCLGTAVAPDFTATSAGVRSNTFSIATGADGRNALFCSTNSAGNPIAELVPGVEAMQVLFGEDTNADRTADRFLPPTVTVNNNNVVAVRVYLLFSGKENVKLDNASTTYTLAGVAYTFSDNKIRRVVTSTITLRNRAP